MDRNRKQDKLGVGEKVREGKKDEKKKEQPTNRFGWRLSCE